MTKAALPNYMQEHLKSPDMPPGHIFGLYFPVWRDDWSKADSEKTAALKKATRLSDNSRKMAEALIDRQQFLALQNDALGYFPAISTSPFMTGIGNEHPLENGFAFLNPYGLPYLPGSSIKGVLRTAAEELALGLYGETQGWDMLAVWWLFGFDAGSTGTSSKPYKGDDILVEEAKRRRDKYTAWVTKGEYHQDSLESFIKATIDKKNQKIFLQQPEEFLIKLPDDLSNKGAISFWDVYPQSKSLAIDILTPHHGGYLQGKNAPHDSEQPVPNVFLTVPPGSQFHFYTSCEIEGLPEALQQNWQPLLQAAFEHAFDWLGFGAKTAVGYGQMKQDKNSDQILRDIKETKLQQRQVEIEQLEFKQRLAKMSKEQLKIQELRQKLTQKTASNVKEQIGGPLYSALKELVSQTNEWSTNDKSELFGLAKDLLEFIGAIKNSKAKELLKSLQ